MYFMFGPTMLLLIPAVILAAYAQMKVRSTYARYSRIRSQQGWSGAQAARRILDSAGISNVSIKETSGRLSDHYDPRNRTLYLSEKVFEGDSLASLGVAAHEAGHALQHARGYVPLNIRSAIVPVASFGTNGAYFLFFLGLLARNGFMMSLAIILEKR